MRDRRRPGRLDSPDQHENDHDDKDQAQSAAREVALASAVAPAREGPDQSQDQQDDENRPQHRYLRPGFREDSSLTVFPARKCAPTLKVPLPADRRRLTGEQKANRTKRERFRRMNTWLVSCATRWLLLQWLDWSGWCARRRSWSPERAVAEAKLLRKQRSWTWRRLAGPEASSI